MADPPSFRVVEINSGILPAGTNSAFGFVNNKGVGSCGIVVVPCVGRMTNLSYYPYFLLTFSHWNTLKSRRGVSEEVILGVKEFIERDILKAR